MDENLLKIQELESRVESLHEKLGEAKIVLKMIAKYEPKKTWVETSYNNGSYIYFGNKYIYVCCNIKTNSRNIIYTILTNA